MDPAPTQTCHSESQRITRAITLFLGIVGVAMALSALFATVLSSQIGLPQDKLGFVLTALQISAFVVIPLAIFAAQNDYRLVKFKDQLEEFASTDALTGLLNRRYFQHRLGEELQRMSRTGEDGAIVLFDLDHFKAVNDTYGHKAGDAVLRAVSMAVSSELRGPMDRIARWGGEEFIILLSNLTRTDAISVCERLRERIENTVVYHGSEKISFTASFGVAALLAHDAPQDTIESADVALYQAKRNGRNQTVAAPERARQIQVANDAGPNPAALRSVASPRRA
ncbi:MAG: GGDEF domain-containing protein [Pseudomonadota bacterium]